MESWTDARPYIIPGRHAEPPFDGLLTGARTLAQFSAEHKDRVDPVYDDRPFFFARQKPWGLPGSMKTAFALIVTPLLALCVAFLYLGRPRGAAKGPYAGSVVYFSALGVSLHRRGAGPSPAPHASSGPPDLHPLHPAVHAARRRWPRQLGIVALFRGSHVSRRCRPRLRLRTRPAVTWSRCFCRSPSWLA